MCITDYGYASYKIIYWSETMLLTFYGHAAFVLESSDCTIALDPFISGNPVAPKNVEVLPDYILVTHGHGDHLGDALPLAQKSNAVVIGVFELANYFMRHGTKAHSMHIGGSHNFGAFKVKITQALHGNSMGGDLGPAEYLGNPCGFLITIDNKNIYYAGDTGLFGDMQLIGNQQLIDLALLPIGDNFTMGPQDAVEAVKMLQPKLVIPMHYNTWPLIAQDPFAFKMAVEGQSSSKVIILNPGEQYKI